MGVTFKLIKKIGTIGETSKGEKKLQLVSWNGGEPTYDLRTWLSDGKATSGITFSKEDLLRIVEIYKNNGVEEEAEEETEKIDIDALFSMNEPEEEIEKEPTEEKEEVVEKPKKRGRKPKAEKQEEPVEKPESKKQASKDGVVITFPSKEHEEIEVEITDTDYSYAECCSKLDKVFSVVKSIPQYVLCLQMLKDYAKNDEKFIQNAMREDRTFEGMMLYLKDKVKDYCINVGDNFGIMDGEMVFAFMVDYFNAKKEEPKVKPKTTKTTKKITKKTSTKKEVEDDVDDLLPFN